MKGLPEVFDILVQDRNGLWTSVWMVYLNNAIISVEYTRGKSGLTARVDLTQAKAA